MPKASKGGWYAVAVGRRVGIYTTWEECCEQVKGFSRAKYKKFPSKVRDTLFERFEGLKSWVVFACVYYITFYLIMLLHVLLFN